MDDKPVLSCKIVTVPNTDNKLCIFDSNTNVIYHKDEALAGFLTKDNTIPGEITVYNILDGSTVIKRWYYWSPHDFHKYHKPFKYTMQTNPKIRNIEIEKALKYWKSKCAQEIVKSHRFNTIEKDEVGQQPNQ